MAMSVRRWEILPALSLPPASRRCCYVTARDLITWAPDHVTLLWWHVKCTWSGARSCPQNNQCMMRRYGRVRSGSVFGNKLPGHVTAWRPAEFRLKSDILSAISIGDKTEIRLENVMLIDKIYRLSLLICPYSPWYHWYWCVHDVYFKVIEDNGLDVQYHDKPPHKSSLIKLSYEVI